MNLALIGHLRPDDRRAALAISSKLLVLNSLEPQLPRPAASFGVAEIKDSIVLGSQFQRTRRPACSSAG